jgi:hypothetical protein
MEQVWVVGTDVSCPWSPGSIRFYHTGTGYRVAGSAQIHLFLTVPLVSPTVSFGHLIMVSPYLASISGLKVAARVILGYRNGINMPLVPSCHLLTFRPTPLTTFCSSLISMCVSPPLGHLC